MMIEVTRPEPGLACSDRHPFHASSIQGRSPVVPLSSLAPWTRRLEEDMADFGVTGAAFTDTWRLEKRYVNELRQFKGCLFRTHIGYRITIPKGFWEGYWLGHMKSDTEKNFNYVQLIWMFTFQFNFESSIRSDIMEKLHHQGNLGAIGRRSDGQRWKA